jgi:hypothetical protein
MGKITNITKSKYESITGIVIDEELLDGRTQAKFLKDVEEYQTVDGKPRVATADDKGYETNELPTQYSKVIVEQKYGSGEATGFVGANYVTKDGRVKNYQAKFVLGKEIEIPETAVESLRRAKQFIQRKEEVQGKMRKVIREVQKYIIDRV